MDESSNSRSFLAIVEVADESDPDTEWAIVDAVAEDSLGLVLRSVRGDPTNESSEDEWDVLALRCRTQALMERNVVTDNRAIWYRVEVARHPSPRDIEAEVVLLGDTEGEPPKVGIRQIEQAERRVASELTAWAMLMRERRSAENFISGILDLALEGVDEDIAVAAYDVGQGNCNAIVDTYEHPRVFYDLGWPPNFNARTRPQRKPNLFSCQELCVAPVVLSHWDMDHWAYAVRSTTFDSPKISSRANWNDAALRRFWLARAPQQQAHQLGPMHMKLFEALRKVELLPGLPALQLWPDRTRRIRFRHGWIEACAPLDGSAGNRNNSGLAMFVVDRHGHAVLLPGDADFSSIPTLRGWWRPRAAEMLATTFEAWWRRGFDGLLRETLALWWRSRLVGLVASHHGGRVDPRYVPRPLEGSPATLVISVGDGNNYGHPKQEALSAYATRNWRELRTSSRIPCPGPDRHAHELGNRLIPFPKAPLPRCGCGCVIDGRLCLSTDPQGTTT